MIEQTPKQEIERDSILHSVIFENIDHDKFFVVIGVSEDQIARFFFINSRIHPVIEKRPAQFAMQYLLRKMDYDFLKYDSFLCATNIIKLPISRLSKTIEDGHTVFVSRLMENDLIAVLDAAEVLNF